MQSIPILFVLAFFSCTKNSDSLYPSMDIIIPGQLDWQKNLYFKKIQHFKNNPIGKYKIIFLGNSITEGGGDWNKRFQSKSIVNRGISGDYTKGILNRLGEIIFYKPNAVFLMIGINEFFSDNSARPEITPEYVANNILKIARLIKKESPNTKLFLSTILPINNQQYIEVKDVSYNFLHSEYMPSVNEQVETTNLLIKKNKEFPVIDLHPKFLNKDSMMNRDYSKDGVHLNENGYKIWVDEVKDIIIELEQNNN